MATVRERERERFTAVVRRLRVGLPFLVALAPAVVALAVLDGVFFRFATVRVHPVVNWSLIASLADLSINRRGR